MICIVDRAGQEQFSNRAWQQFFNYHPHPSSTAAGRSPPRNLLLHPLILQADCPGQIRDSLRSGASLHFAVPVAQPEESRPGARLQVHMQSLHLTDCADTLMLVQAAVTVDTVADSAHELTHDPVHGAAAGDVSPASHPLQTKLGGLLNLIVHNTPVPLCVKDAHGTYLLANRLYLEQFSPEPFSAGAGIQNLRDDAIFDAASVNRLRDRDQAVLRHCSIQPGEEVLVDIGGAAVKSFFSVRFPVLDEHGNPFAVGNVLIAAPMSEQVASAFAGQNAELQLLLDSLRSAIWYMDCWGLVKLVNRKASELFPTEQMLGHNFMEIAPCWDDPAERHREIMLVIRTGEPLLHSRESCRLGHKTRWFDVDKIPTKNASGQVTGVMVVMTDISSEIAKERALEESEERYRTFASSSSQAVFRYDLEPPVDITLPIETQVRQIAQQARLAECNQVMARLFGVRSVEELLGTPLQDARSLHFMADTTQFVKNGYRLENQQIEVHSRTDSYMQVSIIGVVINGCLVRAWGSTQDITARKRYMDRLEYQATHDSLTDLPNRNYLYREIQVALDSRRHDQKMALMLIDLDRFKEINDTLGHHTGDKLLRQIGPRIQDELADTVSLLARLGGDEFAILLPRIRNNQHAVVVAHRILDAVRQSFDIEGFNTEISASIGIAMAPDQADNLSDLMRYADVAMYHAKSEMLGVSVYRPELDMHSPKRLALMNDLGRAIRENQLQVYFQPKVDIQAHKVYGFEALLRWHHPEMGFIPPVEFVPMAESTKLIHAMTLWVLEASIAECCRWREAGYTFSVAVNLSVRNLLDETLPEHIAELLAQYQLPASALELEITESSIMMDPQRALKALNRINELGIELAIDDFGTGYSSLAYIKRLPVTQLKIDYSFVINMLEDPQDEIIVNSTINLAHNLGLGVIAEGVESAEHLERLKALGCDMAQGYLIGRPMPAAEVLQWLQRGDWL